MDRKSQNELRVAEALCAGESVPGADTATEAVERAASRTYGDGFAEMVACAEKHPDLVEQLPELVSLRAGLRARRSEILGAIAGPLVTLVAAIAACAVAAQFVLPRFSMWITELSLPTPSGFAVSRAAMDAVFGPIGAVSVVALIAIAVWLAARGALSKLAFRIGSVAAPYRAAASRTLAIATDIELPRDEALTLTAAVISHRHASAALLAGRRPSSGGAPLWQVLGDVVPADLLTTIRAADDRTLASALDALAAYFSVESEASRRTVRTLVGTSVTAAASVLCVWLAVTVASGYAALFG